MDVGKVLTAQTSIVRQKPGKFTRNFDKTAPRDALLLKQSEGYRNQELDYTREERREEIQRAKKSA